MNLNPGTWQSVIRSVGLILGGMLAYAGLISQTSVADIVQKAVDAAPVIIQAISVLGSLAIAIQGARTHTDPQVVKAASALAIGPDPQIKPIQTLPTAPPAIQAIADDKNVPGVVAAPSPAYAPPPKRHP